MNPLPCRERTFPFRMSAAAFYGTYARWLRHLSERLGFRNAAALWKRAFEQYDDAPLVSLLSPEWRIAPPADGQWGGRSEDVLAEFFRQADPNLPIAEARNLLDGTPLLSHLTRRFGDATVEREVSAYEALHLRFDGLACLAEALIAAYGKQGELIVYDLMLASRLAAAKGQSGSVEDFIEDFTAESETPSLFTAGLQVELVSKTAREAVLHVRECEWARYFRERHPQVGYLMACSTDEAAYRAFNPGLRLQRTQTLMEGADFCDFRVHAVAEKG